MLVGARCSTYRLICSGETQERAQRSTHAGLYREGKKAHTWQEIRPGAAASDGKQKKRLHRAVRFPTAGGRIKQKAAVEWFLH